ncbi:MAG: hypothetical protein AAGJ93_09245, partial [Bacteroidota bacterium]
DQIKKEQRDLEQQTRKARTELVVSFRDKAKVLAGQKHEVLRQELAQNTAELDALSVFQSEVEKRVHNLGVGAVSAYRANNESARSYRGFKRPVVWDEISAESLLYGNLYIHSKPSVSHNGSVSSLNLNKVTHLILLFIMACVGVSCTNEAPPSTEVLVLVDVTDSILYQPDQIANYINQEILDLGDNSDVIVTYGAVNVTISTIGATSIQPKYTTGLAASGNLFTRVEKEQKQAIQDFQKELKTALHTVMASQQGQEKTLLHRSFCMHLPALSNADADRKVVLLLSDLIENSQAVSFYQYQQETDLLMQEYSQLVNRLSSDCELGDLNGIEIYASHLPKKEEDEIVVQALRFWEQYLGQQGGTIHFVVNI